MQKRRLWRTKKTMLVALSLAVVVGSPTAVMATTSSSVNYQVTETQFGAGSALQSCSDQYCARVSIGDPADGPTTSGVTSATFGAITSSEPLLEVIVDAGSSNLGVLTAETTATKTMTVRIRNYLSGGYVLQIIGTAPKYGDHTLSTSATPTASTPGIEQFAINAAANTTPLVGAAAVQVPSDQISFGAVSTDYRTPNLFKYVSGDVVARSLTQSGRTDYTVSMIVNISNATPAGRYAGDFAAVVVPVY